MKIRMVIGETSLAATLEDNPTALDFAALLPAANEPTPENA